MGHEGLWHLFSQSVRIRRNFAALQFCVFGGGDVQGEETAGTHTERLQVIQDTQPRCLES